MADNRTDWSWIAAAGQQLAGVITQIPAAVNYTKMLKDHRVKTADVYAAVEKNVNAMPKEAVDALGTTKIDILNARPKPEKNEDPRAYSARIVAWYKPIVQRLVDSGIPADTIQAWGTATAEGAGALADERVAESLGAARKTQQANARTTELERRGEQAMQPDMVRQQATPEAMASTAAGPVRPGEAVSQPTRAGAMGLQTPQMQPSFAVPGTAARSPSEMMGSRQFSEPIAGKQVSPDEIKGTRSYQALAGRQAEQGKAAEMDMKKQQLVAALRRNSNNQELSDYQKVLVARHYQSVIAKNGADYDRKRALRNEADAAKEEMATVRAQLDKEQPKAAVGAVSSESLEPMKDRIKELQRTIDAAKGIDAEAVDNAKRIRDSAIRESESFLKKHGMPSVDNWPDGFEESASGAGQRIGGYVVEEVSE